MFRGPVRVTKRIMGLGREAEPLRCKKCGSENLKSKAIYVFGSPSFGKVSSSWLECSDCGARRNYV